jgi:hypothetical protein
MFAKGCGGRVVEEIPFFYDKNCPYMHFSTGHITGEGFTMVVALF